MSRQLLASAAALRCGLTLPVTLLPADPCDDPGPLLGGFVPCNAATPADPANAWQTISGAVALDAGDASAGAIAEALERLAAAQAPFETRARHAIAANRRLDEATFALFSESQRAQPGFPWPLARHDDDLFAEVFALADNQPYWVAQELVGLGPRRGDARMPSTSSGLAAWRDAAGGPWLALLRALQELLERDALAATWINGIGGRELAVPAAWRAHVEARGGHLQVFDLTQDWNPHPVIAVAGGMPCEGRPRHVLGLACRGTRGAAVHKALLEWWQALAFAAHITRERRSSLVEDPALLRTFHQHAAFYTLRPELWRRTALIAGARPGGEHIAPGQVGADPNDAASALAQLQALRQRLAASGIDVYYRELTTADVAAAGLRVMRVLSPQLSGLHADERAPFLGGRLRDLSWRYPGAVAHAPFPNPLPHPLG